MANILTPKRFFVCAALGVLIFGFILSAAAPTLDPGHNGFHVNFLTWVFLVPSAISVVLTISLVWAGVIKIKMVKKGTSRPSVVAPIGLVIIGLVVVLVGLEWYSQTGDWEFFLTLGGVGTFVSVVGVIFLISGILLASSRRPAS